MTSTPKTSKNISAGSAGRTLAVLHSAGTFAMVPFARSIQNKLELSQNCKSSCLGLIIGVLVVSAIFYYRMVSGRMSRSRAFFHVLTACAIGLLILRMRLLDVEYFHIASYAVLAIWFYLWFEPSSAARNALIGATCVSGMDEFLQYLTPGRFCDIRDFSINFLGAVLGLLFILPLRPRSSSKSQIQAFMERTFPSITGSLPRGHSRR